MTINHDNLQDESIRRLDKIAEIIPELSKKILAIQKGELGIQTKSNHMDLVTRADLESEKTLKSFISHNFPDDEILAEESGQETRNKASGLCWILDPIDGTINFAHGMPLFAISVGLAWQDKPVAGLVIMPGLGDSYRAIQGQGAYKNSKKISVSQNTDFSKSLVVTGFPYSRHKYLDELLATVHNILQSARGLRRTGTAALDLCWLAEGIFDVHYELHLNAWDTCAGAVILTEAGGKISNFKGDEWNMHDRNMAASNSHVHAAMLECLEPLVELENKIK